MTEWNDETQTAYAPEEEWNPFCLWCGRATDHTGEHEELRMLGLLEYDYTAGMVVPTKLGDAVRADADLVEQLSNALGRVWEMKWKIDHGS